MKSKYNPKERANKKDIQLNIDSENKLSKAMREVCETELIIPSEAPRQPVVLRE